MKKPLLLFFIILFSLYPASSQYVTDFRVGLFNAGNQPSFYSPTNYARFQDLNLTQMIKYTYHKDSEPDWEGGFNDSLDTQLPYLGSIRTVFSDLSTNGMQVLAEREKIMRPAYGQQSDYQAEMINPQSQSPGYGWQARSGITYTETWQGESVQGINTGTPDNNGMWLLTGLYENGEQTNAPGYGEPENNLYPHQYYLSDNKLNDPALSRWYIEPRMRISTTDALNPTVKPVCRIEVRAYNNDVVLNIVLSTSDFRDKDGNYNGEYLDKYYRLGSHLDLFVEGDSLNRNNPISLDGRSEDPSGTQVDYRIYWYGKVNVWIDRVRVEDSWSFALFNDELAEEIGLQFYFKWKIQQEAQSLTDEPIYFYQDEFQYNMIPCIAKVNQLIRAKKPQSGLVSLVNDWWWREGSGLINPPEDYTHYIEKVQPPMLMVSSYPFDDFVKLPPESFIPKPDDLRFPGTKNQVNAVTKEEYNECLQDILDNGKIFTKTQGWCVGMKLPAPIDRIKRAASSVHGTAIPFHFNAQVHAYEDGWTRVVNNCRPWVSREPITEEIRLMTNLALCYGASGLKTSLFRIDLLVI